MNQTDYFAHENVVHIHEKDRAAWYLEFENTWIRWLLSINEEYLPKEVKEKGQTAFRFIAGKELEFIGGFANLHILVYKDILKWKWCLKLQKQL